MPFNLSFSVVIRSFLKWFLSRRIPEERCWRISRKFWKSSQCGVALVRMQENKKISESLIVKKNLDSYLLSLFSSLSSLLLWNWENSDPRLYTERAHSVQKVWTLTSLDNPICGHPPPYICIFRNLPSVATFYFFMFRRFALQINGLVSIWQRPPSWKSYYFLSLWRLGIYIVKPLVDTRQRVRVGLHIF